MSGNKAIFLLLTVPFIWLLNKTRAPINGRNPCLTATPNSSIILRCSKTTKMALFEKFETLIYNKIKMDVILIHWEAMCSIFIFKQISSCVFIFSGVHFVPRTHCFYEQPWQGPSTSSSIFNFSFPRLKPPPHCPPGPVSSGKCISQSTRVSGLGPVRPSQAFR